MVGQTSFRSIPVMAPMLFDVSAAVIGGFNECRGSFHFIFSCNFGKNWPNHGGWCPPGVGGHCLVKYRPVTDELLISKDSQLPQSLRGDVSFFYRDHFVT